MVYYRYLKLAKCQNILKEVNFSMIRLKEEIQAQQSEFLDKVQKFGEANTMAKEYLREIIIPTFHAMAHQHMTTKDFSIVVKVESRESSWITTTPFVEHQTKLDYFGNVSVSEIWSKVLILVQTEVPDLETIYKKDMVGNCWFTFKLSID